MVAVNVGVGVKVGVVVIVGVTVGVRESKKTWYRPTPQFPSRIRRSIPPMMPPNRMLNSFKR
jgi:hypothetical protein